VDSGLGRRGEKREKREGVEWPIERPTVKLQTNFSTRLVLTCSHRGRALLTLLIMAPAPAAVGRGPAATHEASGEGPSYDQP
jgi:hypothetical protein